VSLAELLDELAAGQRVDHLANAGPALRAARTGTVVQTHALAGIDQQQHAAVLDQLPLGAFLQVKEIEQDADQGSQSERDQRPAKSPWQLGAVFAIHRQHIAQDRCADRRQHQPMPPLGQCLQTSELIKRASCYFSQQRPRCAHA